MTPTPSPTPRGENENFRPANCTCTCNCADNHEAGCNDPCCGCDGGHDVAALEENE